MADLTRDYLDKKLDNLATKDDIKNLEVKLEEKIDDLAIMVARGFTV